MGGEAGLAGFLCVEEGGRTQRLSLSIEREGMTLRLSLENCTSPIFLCCSQIGNLAELHHRCFLLVP